MSESVSQLKVGAALDGSFETVTQTVKTKLKELSNTAKDTGDKLGGMGDGTTQAAQKVDQATKSMVSSIQRTTALMDSGARGSVEYYKALANQRGIDTSALKPYLDQLEAVKVKQAQAAAAMLTGSQSLDKVGMSAAATANALRGVPAQFTDIVTSIQGGQAPLTVFLQQGGQLKDMFGGAGNAAKALGGYVLGLINPYTLAAGAAAGLAIAYEAGAAESRAFNSALILSGNQAGVTTGQLMAMASSIDQISGTQGAAAEALALFAASGKIGAENLEKFTLTAIRFEKVTGTSIGDTVKKFEELRKAPLEATLKLNETMGYLTQTVYDQIKALTEQGRVTDAAALAQEEFNKATASMAGDMEKNLGTVQRSWMSVKSAVTETWDAIKGIGRDAGLEGQVAAAQKMVDIRKQAANSIYGNASDLVKLSEAENQLKGYQELLKNQQLSAQYAAERTAYVKSQVEFDKESDKYLSKSVQMQQAIAAAQERFAKVSQTPENLAKYAQEVEGIQKKFEETAKKATTARAAVNQAAKDDIAAARLMADLKTKFDGDEMKRIADLAKAKAEAFAKSAEAYGKELDARAIANADQEKSAYDYAQAVDEGIKRTEFEISLMGKTGQARAIALGQYEIELRLQKQILEVKKSIADESVKDQAIAGLNATAIREKAAVANRVMVDEFKKTSDSINSTLTDALMRGFESGKDFARNLRDTVVNMFKTMVLRPIISAVMSPISGAITGAMGLSGAAQAAGAATSGAGAIGSVGTLASLATTAASWGTAAGAGFMATLGGSTIAGGGAAGILATGGAAGASTAGMIGAAGPYALAAVAALAAVGAFRTTKKVGEGITGTLGGDNQSLNSFEEMRKSGYLFGGPKYWDELKSLDAAMAKSINTDFTAIKTAAKAAATALGLSADSVAGFSKAIRITFTGDKTKDDALYKEYMAGVSEDLARTILGSYKETVATVIDQIATNDGGGEGGSWTYSTAERQVKTTAYTPSEFAKDGETAGQTLQRLAASLTLVNANSDLLGNALLDIGLKGANTASLLIDAFGGAEAYAAQMGSYYANFYRQSEQTAYLTEKTTAAFEALDLAMPKLDESARDVYRSLVDEAAAKDMSVESNRAAYASLIALQGPMNQLAPAFDAVTESVKTTANEIASTNARLQDQLDVLKGTATNRSIALRDATDESTRGLLSQIYAQEDLAESAKLASAALEKASESSKAAAAAAIESSKAAAAAAIEAQRIAYEGAKNNAQSAYGKLQESVNAEKTALGAKLANDKQAITDRYKLQSDANAAQISSARTAADSIKGIASALAAAVKQVQIDSPAYNFASLQSARSLISTADPMTAGLTDALGVASKDTKAFYGTFEDYAFAQAVTAADILKLNVKAQAQITTAEAIVQGLAAQSDVNKLLSEAEIKAAEAGYDAQIAALDAVQANGLEQLNALLGIDARVLSVAEAVAGLSGALSGLAAAQAAQTAAVSAAASAASSAVSSGSAATSTIDGMTVGGAGSGQYYTDSQGNNVEVPLGQSKAYFDALGQSGLSAASSLQELQAGLIAQGKSSVYEQFAGGLNVGTVGYEGQLSPTVFGSDGGIVLSAGVGGPRGQSEADYQQSIKDWLKASGVPGYAVGTPFVPEDGLAYLHKGEAVIPAAYNPANTGTSQTNGDMVAELKAIRAELAAIKASTNATAGHTAGTDRKLSRVIKNDALITEAA